jgi:hypothetical protein
MSTEQTFYPYCETRRVRYSQHAAILFLLFSSTLIATNLVAVEEFREDFERHQVGQPLGSQSKCQGGRPERSGEATALVVAGGVSKSRKEKGPTDSVSRPASIERNP